MRLPTDTAPWTPLALALALMAGCAVPPGVELVPEPPLAAPAAASAPVLVVLPAPPAPAASAPSETSAVRLLAWQDRLRELSAAELAREVARRDSPADAGASIELALALAQSRALAQAAGAPANGELARALALLEPHLRSPSPWQATARLLHARLAEQRKLDEQIDRLQQQLREQQRRNDQLAAQIEALRAIERSLGNARPAAPPPPSAPAPAPR